MRALIKRIIPKRYLKFIRKIILEKKLNELYEFDKTRHKKYAYTYSDQWTINNLRAKITFHYHSIEKGLSHPNIRLGFGKNAFTELFYAMDLFIDNGYSTQDRRFQQGISVIENYIKLHNQHNFEVEWVTSKLQVYLKYQMNDFMDSGGYGVKRLNEIPNYKDLNFKILAQNRYSIRDFGPLPVDDVKVNDAIQIATKTPSVCNRQAFKVYRIKNKEILDMTYRMQGGLITHGENLQEIILVTSSREFMNGEHERNQTYVDGGMFLMSLTYALTYHQIATCILNADFDLKREKAMRDLLNISYAEDLIAFIAIGTFKDVNKFAKSPRETWEGITVMID